MDLVNRAVTHKAFGKGIIVGQTDTSVVVKFEKSEANKSFQYPLAFNGYLSFADTGLDDEIQADVEKRLDELEEDKVTRLRDAQMKLDKNEEDSGKKRAPKKVAKPNIAIKCNYCDGGMEKNDTGFYGVCSDKNLNYNIEKRKYAWCIREDGPCRSYHDRKITRQQLEDMYEKDGFCCYESKMLREWEAFAGMHFSNGKNGKVVKFKGISSNSLAVLTTRMNLKNEAERVIFAVFLVKDHYEGDAENQGRVSADSEYRIKLTLEEAKQLRFWDFYFCEGNDTRPFWGTGLHRYMLDEQAAQILKQIIEIKSDPKEKEYVTEFLNHFCELKGIDPTLIAEPNGALIRAKTE